MATNNTTKNQCQQVKTFQNQQLPQSSIPSSQNLNYEPLDKSSSNTLKRNPKMEFSKADLLKLLSYLEGELQARDVVIATLKSEKVKQLLTQGRYRPLTANEPLAALHRDNFAAVNTKVDEAQICSLAEHQLNSLENLVLQQRRAQIRIARLLKDAELRHRKVVQELVEEKRKHEHDTAQGDDITYGLEKERTRLKQELEMEKQAKKRLEKELKKLTDIAEEEKNRQKQIVLLLLAERKKIIMKYVEERKRSEDLAQILTEEKGRMDSMAEGLEEESKKSLQMEAELEKQLAQFDSESQQLKTNLLKEEKRAKELETELERAKNEVASLEKQLAEAHQVAMFQANANLVGAISHGHPHPRAPLPPSKPSVIPPQTSPRLTPPGKGSVSGGLWTDGGVVEAAGATPMMSSVAKVVQPTATVSSVPVCGPTTGIARSVSPGHSLRGVAVGYANTTNNTSTAAEVDKRTAAVTPRMASPAAKKQPPVARGAPPPVPPNKPIIPPKKEISRRGDAPIDDMKSSPQTLKYGISMKEKAGGGGGGGGPTEQVGVAGGAAAAAGELTQPVDHVQLDLHDISLNASS